MALGELALNGNLIFGSTKKDQTGGISMNRGDWDTSGPRPPEFRDANLEVIQKLGELYGIFQQIGTLPMIGELRGQATSVDQEQRTRYITTSPFDGFGLSFHFDLDSGSLKQIYHITGKKRTSQRRDTEMISLTMDQRAAGYTKTPLVVGCNARFAADGAFTLSGDLAEKIMGIDISPRGTDISVWPIGEGERNNLALTFHSGHETPEQHWSVDGPVGRINGVQISHEHYMGGFIIEGGTPHREYAADLPVNNQITVPTCNHLNVQLADKDGITTAQWSRGKEKQSMIINAGKDLNQARTLDVIAQRFSLLKAKMATGTL